MTEGASDETSYFDLTRLTRLTRLRYFISSGVKVDRWLQTFLRTSIGTRNSVQVITLRMLHSFSRYEWNALDVILSNASCISQAHLSLVLLHTSPAYAKELGDVLTVPERTKEYIPNLMERGGFSIDIVYSEIFEKLISVPRQISYSGCT